MNDLYEKNGAPLKGKALNDTKTLLTELGMNPADDLEYTTTLYTKENQLIATGSLSGQVIKCVAIAPEFQGQGLLARILTTLLTESNHRGIHHLFLYTKPKNERLFGSLGFYPIVKTSNVLLMENINGGISQYISELQADTGNRKGIKIGAIVANCNPFTKGHQYLLEQAANQCDLLHLFILKDGKVAIEKRMSLVKIGTQHIKNLVVHQTDNYLISRVTFPEYFIKESISEAWYELDIAVFCDCIAPALGINVRFVGTEPTCFVTQGYNKALKEILPMSGIRVIEIERLKLNDVPISASTVRCLLEKGREEEAKALVPPDTWNKTKTFYYKNI